VNEKCYAVLTAGGESSGPGSPYTAQLMEDADGRPIYLYTVEALAGSGLFEEIILYVPAGIAPAVKRRLAEALPDAPVTVLAGNPSQLEAALQTADRIPDAPDTVLVLHDLLRPFVTDRILQEAAIRRCLLPTRCLSAETERTSTGFRTDRIFIRNRRRRR
jgi:2-C-methyl-D-erythritol 4-phosphate cytidylyltransferase